MRVTPLALLCLVSSAPSFAQFSVTAQPGVPYPALSSPQVVTLTAPGGHDPLDRGRVLILLGFLFPYSGRLYSSITVTANGMAFLEPSSAPNLSSDFPTNQLGSAAEPNGVLAVLWDDLTGSNSTSELRKQPLIGPNGRGYAIEWKNWNRTFGQYSLTFQLRIWENGIIEYFYADLSGAGAAGLSASVGVESPTGSLATHAFTGCTTDCSLASFDPGLTGTPVSYIRFGPPPGVDLQPLAFEVSSLALDGGTLEIDSALTIRNVGTLATSGFEYRLVLSQDTVVDEADVEFTPTDADLLSLGALGQLTHRRHAAAPARDGGSWYVLAQLDPAQSVVESNEFNNVIGSPVAYTAQVDLVALSVTPPPVAAPLEPVSVSVRFANQGFAAAGAVSVALYASLDAELSADDVELARQTLTCAGGQTIERTLSFVLPPAVAAGEFSVLLQLDDAPLGGAVPEVSELNNVVASATSLTVRQADLQVVELQVLDPSRSTSVAEPTFGAPVRLEALVRNTGGARASNVRLDFFLSDNQTLNALTDVFVTSSESFSLEPGLSQRVVVPLAIVPSLSVSGAPLSTGPYTFFAAAIAPGLSESQLDNNVVSAAWVLIREPTPDVVVRSIEAPRRLAAGEVVAVSRSFANVGALSAPRVAYRYVLSANELITASDTPLAIVTAGGDVDQRAVGLAVGGVDDGFDLVRLPADVPDLARVYIGVLLDPDASLDEVHRENDGLAALPSTLAGQVSTLAMLPDGVVGLDYSAQLAPPRTTHVELVSPQQLPAGLVLDPTGHLHGTPTSAGVYSLGFWLVREGQRVALAVRPLRIAALGAPLEIDEAPLPPAASQSPYYALLGAQGGVAPYVFSVVGGALPLGLVLEPSGAVRGVTSAPGGSTFDVTLRVNDALGNVDERAFTVPVVSAQPLAIQTLALSSGIVGQQMVAGLLVHAADAGVVTRPVTWGVVEGVLPPGLVLEPTSSEQAVISGTPSEPGAWRFVLDVRDAQGRTDRQAYVLSIAAAGARVVGDWPARLTPGQSVHVSFTLDPATPGAEFVVRDGSLPTWLTLGSTIDGTVPLDAADTRATFTLEARSQLTHATLAMRTLSVVVEPAERRGGCSSAPGPTVTLVLLLWLNSRARRRAVHRRS